MCLAYPMQIDGVRHGMAEVSAGTVKSTVSVQLIGKVKAGDYVLVHAGFAIEKIDKDRADEILTLIAELGQAMDDK